MKYFKTIFCLITFVVIFSMLGICAFASGNNYHDNCVSEHFDFIQDESLGKHDKDGLYPSNTIGSCPYVAMSLLLSYYDAYWNDDFVPVDYETMGRFDENTGIIENEFHFTLENTDWWNIVTNQNLDLDTSEAQEAYSVFIQNTSDDFFQMYLISLGIREGFHNGDLTYGLTDPEMVEFLEFYLYDICHFNSNQVTVHLMTENIVINTDEDLIDTARNLIENGAPVIYGGYSVEFGDKKTHQLMNPDIGGHYLFAYDVIEDDDDILLSICWNGDDTTSFRTTDYKYVSSIIWLEINEEAFPHVCSNSYESVISDEEYCVCEIYSEHPDHVHQLYTGLESCPEASFTSRCNCGEAVNGTHVYNIRVYSSTEHWYECACGDKENIKPHSFSYIDGNDDSTHTLSCSCGYSITEEHNYEYEQLSDGSHSGDCVCGHSIEENHNYEYEQLSDGRHLGNCICGYSFVEIHAPSYWQKLNTSHCFLCICGYWSDFEQHSLVQQDYHTSVCDVCGYTETTPHSSSYQQLSDTHHLVICGCGYEGEAPHNFTCVSVSSSLHRLTCDCGYTTLEAHNFRETNNPRYYSCTKCGYTRDNFGPGGNVQMGIKKEEETE